MLYHIYGKKCMITDIVTELALHHLDKVENGGKTTLDNGAILFYHFHQYLHNELEQKNYQLYQHVNDILIVYKKIVVTPQKFMLQDIEDVHKEKEKIKTLYFNSKRR